MRDLSAFHYAVAAVCPLVVSVSIPDPTDRSTWVVQYSSQPADDQLAAVQQAIAEFDVAKLEPRRLVLKSVIIERLNTAGKLQAASQALNSDVFVRERWYAPDKPAVYADDSEALALLAAIGADPAVILAP